MLHLSFLKNDFVKNVILSFLLEVQEIKDAMKFIVLVNVQPNIVIFINQGINAPDKC